MEKWLTEYKCRRDVCMRAKGERVRREGEYRLYGHGGREQVSGRQGYIFFSFFKIDIFKKFL